MSVTRGMKKEDVVHIYNGILLGHKKEQNWVISRDVDGPGDCHTEWSKSDSHFKITLAIEQKMACGVGQKDWKEAVADEWASGDVGLPESARVRAWP